MVLVLLGAVLLLNNLGITTISIGDIIETYWPIVLVALGLTAVLRPRGDETIRDERTEQTEPAEPAEPHEIGEAREPYRASGPNVGGWILIGIGVLMLAANTRLWGFDLSRLWGTFWALVVILVGWTVLRSSPLAGQVGSTQWVVMSGLEQRTTGWPLRSGSYVVVMGGADLDLRVADVPDGDVGEIWLHGLNIGKGYWNKDDETEATFHNKLVTPLESGSHAEGTDVDAR